MRPRFRSRRQDQDSPRRPRDLDATPVVLAAALFVLSLAVIAFAAFIPDLVSSVDLRPNAFRPAPTPVIATSPTGTPAASGSPATPTPGLPAVNGSPLSLSDLQRGWERSGLSAGGSPASSCVTGFAVTPADVYATNGGVTVLLAVSISPYATAI